MAKSLFIFPFPFSFLLDLLYKKKYRKVSCHKCHISHSHIIRSHRVMLHNKSHDKCGKVVHRPCSSCISSIKNLTGTPSSFPCVTNFIWPYLHQFFNDSHSLNSYRKLSKRPFDQYQSRLETINNGQDIRQINR